MLTASIRQVCLSHANIQICLVCCQAPNQGAFAIDYRQVSPHSKERPMKSAKSRLPVRDRILATASELFYREGVHCVGVDRIVAESGVAKMSLYKHFQSKDALVATWLEQRGAQWRAWFQTRVEERAGEPRDRLVAVFDVLQEWFEQPDFRGCPSINSAVELPADHPGYQVCQRHQQALFEYLRTLAAAAGAADPEELAGRLAILVEGAIVVAMMSRQSQPAQQAKAVAIALLAG